MAVLTAEKLDEFKLVEISAQRTNAQWIEIRAQLERKSGISFPEFLKKVIAKHGKLVYDYVTKVSAGIKDESAIDIYVEKDVRTLYWAGGEDYF